LFSCYFWQFFQVGGAFFQGREAFLPGVWGVLPASGGCSSRGVTGSSRGFGFSSRPEKLFLLALSILLSGDCGLSGAFCLRFSEFFTPAPGGEIRKSVGVVEQRDTIAQQRITDGVAGSDGYMILSDL
jgi:hypothetical protein